MAAQPDFTLSSASSFSPQTAIDGSVKDEDGFAIFTESGDYLVVEDVVTISAPVKSTASYSVTVFGPQTVSPDLPAASTSSLSPTIVKDFEISLDFSESTAESFVVQTGLPGSVEDADGLAIFTESEDYLVIEEVAQPEFAEATTESFAITIAGAVEIEVDFDSGSTSSPDPITASTVFIQPDVSLSTESFDPVLQGSVSVQPELGTSSAESLFPSIGTYIEVGAPASTATSFGPQVTVPAFIDVDFPNSTASSFDPADVQEASHPGFTSSSYAVWAPRISVDLPEGPALNVAYKCILTGSADSTTDLDLSARMKSFSARLQATNNSTLQVVIAGVDSLVDDITARSNGSIVISRGFKTLSGDVGVFSELFRMPFTSIRTDEGGVSASTTLQGADALTNPSPATVPLENVITRRITDEAYSFRAEPVDGILPGDTVTYDGDSLDVSNVAFAVSPEQATMDVS